MNREQIDYEIARIEATIRNIDFTVKQEEEKIRELKEYREFNAIILKNLRTLDEGHDLTLTMEDSKKLLGLDKRKMMIQNERCD